MWSSPAIFGVGMLERVSSAEHQLEASAEVRARQEEIRDQWGEQRAQLPGILAGAVQMGTEIPLRLVGMEQEGGLMGMGEGPGGQDKTV